jgi:hypothetical protein
MTQAVFGLVGVLVGALATAGVRGWFEWRDRKRRERIAARKLMAALDWFWTSLDGGLANDDLRRVEDPEYVRQAWEGCHDALADLGYAKWSRVELAVLNTRSVELVSLVREEENRVPIDDELRKALEVPLRRLEEARDLLNPLCERTTARTLLRLRLMSGTRRAA